jgi:hypothetical protein
MALESGVDLTPAPVANAAEFEPPAAPAKEDFDPPAAPVNEFVPPPVAPPNFEPSGEVPSEAFAPPAATPVNVGDLPPAAAPPAAPVNPDFPPAVAPPTADLPPAIGVIELKLAPFFPRGASLPDPAPALPAPLVPAIGESVPFEPPAAAVPVVPEERPRATPPLPKPLPLVVARAGDDKPDFVDEKRDRLDPAEPVLPETPSRAIGERPLDLPVDPPGEASFGPDDPEAFHPRPS